MPVEERNRPLPRVRCGDRVMAQAQKRGLPAWFRLGEKRVLCQLVALHVMVDPGLVQASPQGASPIADEPILFAEARYYRTAPAPIRSLWREPVEEAGHSKLSAECKSEGDRGAHAQADHANPRFIAVRICSQQRFDLLNLPECDSRASHCIGDGFLAPPARQQVGSGGEKPRSCQVAGQAADSVVHPPRFRKQNQSRKWPIAFRARDHRVPRDRARAHECRGRLRTNAPSR